MDDRLSQNISNILNYHANAFYDSINWMIENDRTIKNNEKIYISKGVNTLSNGINIIEAARLAAAYKTQKKFINELTRLGYHPKKHMIDFTDEQSLKSLSSIVDQLIHFKAQRKETQSIKDEFYYVFSETLKNRDPLSRGSISSKKVYESIVKAVDVNTIEVKMFVENTKLKSKLKSNQSYETRKQTANPINDHNTNQKKQEIKGEIEQETGREPILTNIEKVEGNPANEGNITLATYEQKKHEQKIIEEKTSQKRAELIQSMPEEKQQEFLQRLRQKEYFGTEETRKFPDLYEELTDVEIALYQLNNGTIDDEEVIRRLGVPNPSLYQEEVELIERFTSGKINENFLKTINDINYENMVSLSELSIDKDPSVVRNAIYHLEQNLTSFIDRSFHDKKLIDEGIELLSFAKESNLPLDEILLKGDQVRYGHIREKELSKLIIANLSFGGDIDEVNKLINQGVDIAKEVLNTRKNITDQMIRNTLASIYSSARFMETPYFFSMQNRMLKELPSGDKIDPFLSKLKQLSSDFYDINSPRREALWHAISVRKDIFDMKSKLNEQRKDLQNQIVSYLDKDPIQEMINTREEADNNLHRHHTELLRIQEQNDYAYAKLQKQAELVQQEIKEWPRSPVSQLRRALNDVFNEAITSDTEGSTASQLRDEMMFSISQAEENYRLAEQRLQEKTVLKEKSPEDLEEERRLLRMDLEENREKQARINELRKQILNIEGKIYRREMAIEKQFREIVMDQFPEAKYYFSENKSDKERIPKSENEKTTYYKKLNEAIAYAKNELENNHDYLKLHQEIEQLQKQRSILEQELIPLEKVIVEKEELPHGVKPWTDEDIKKAGGWTPDMNITQHEFAILKGIVQKQEMDPEHPGLKVTRYEEKGVNLNLRYRWHSALQNNTPIRLKGSKVPYYIQSIAGNTAILRPDAIVMDRMTIRIDNIDAEKAKEIVNVLQKRIDKDYLNSIEINDEITKSIQTGSSFIEIMFEPDQLDTSDIKKYGSFIEQKFIQSDKLIEALAPQDGIKTIRVTKESVMEQLASQWELLKDDLQSPASSVKLPSFITNMIQSHAPFLMDDSDIIGKASVVFYETMDKLAQKQTTIDLTTEGIMRRWELANRNLDKVTFQQEREKFMDYLSNRNSAQRLEDSLFLNMVSGLLDEHFRVGKVEKDVGLEEIIRQLNERGKEVSAENIYHIIHSPEMKEIVQDPVYRHLPNLSLGEIADYLRDNASEIYMDAFEDPERAVAKYLDHSIELDDLIDEEEGIHKRMIPKELTVKFDDPFINHDPVLEDRLSALEEDRPLFLNVQNDGTIIIRGGSANVVDYEKDVKVNGEWIKEPNQSSRFFGTKNLGLLLDIYEEMDMGDLVVDYDFGETIGRRKAIIQRGNQGDLIAYVPDLEREFIISDTETVPLSSVDIDMVYPQAYTKGIDIGQNHVLPESIGDKGKIKREPLFSSSLQSTGIYDTQTNPSASLDQIIKFFKGNQQGVYLDIESTSLQGSTIDPKYIQPLEISATQIQWDAENGGLLRTEDGKVAVRTSGGNIVSRELVQYVALTDDAKQFAQQILNNEDFVVTYTKELYDPETRSYKEVNRTISVMDYLIEEARFRNKELLAEQRTILNEILQLDNASEILQSLQEKSDKFWYLRNIAKYATLGRERTPEEKAIFIMHTNDNALPTTQDAQIKYLSHLKQDVEKAIQNLSIDSGKVVTLDEAFTKTAKFIGAKPIFGQNVAKADIGMLLHTADLLIDGVRSGNPMHTDKAYAQLVEDFDIVRNYIFDDIKKAFRMKKDKSTLSFMPTEDNQFRDIQSWLKANQDIIASRNINNIGQKLGNQMVKQLVEIENIFDMLSQNPMAELTEAQWDLIDNEGLFTAIEDYRNTSTITNEMLSIQKIKDMREKIKTRPVVEQQYMMKFLHPELLSQRAEDHAQLYGLDVGDQHMAIDDVRTGVEVFDRGLMELIEHPSFNEYVADSRSRNLKRGDYLRMDYAVDNFDRGIYRVDAIDYDNLFIDLTRVDDGTETPIRISSATPEGLIDKIQNNFTFITGGGKAKADEVLAFEQDNTRRLFERALSSPFNFELYELKSDGLYNQNLENLINAHQSAIKKVADYQNAMNQYELSALKGESIAKPILPEFTPLERIAMANNDYFSSGLPEEFLNQETNPTQQKALAAFKDFLETPVGKEVAIFMNDVKRLEQVHAINRDGQASIIKAWNEKIKEEGFARGAKHKLKNNYNLGSMVLGNGITIDDIRIDLTNRQRTEDTLVRIYNRIRKFTPYTQDDLQHTKQTTLVLQNQILPFLKQHGLVDEDFVLKSKENVSFAAVADNIHQNIYGRKIDLAPYEVFDPTKLIELSNDEEFMNILKNTRLELVGEFNEALSPIQQEHYLQLDLIQSDLKRQNAYIPNLNLQPQIQLSDDALLETLHLDNIGGRIKTATVDELIHYTNLIKQSPSHILEDVVAQDTINMIYQELGRRATGGKNIVGAIQDILRDSTGITDQIRAMQALNWIKENPAFQEDPSQPRFIENPNLDEYYFATPAGKHTRYAGMQLRDIDKQTLKEIANPNILDEYRGYDYRAFIGEKIRQYVNGITKENIDGSIIAVTPFQNHRGSEKPLLQVVEGSSKKYYDEIKQRGQTPKHSINEGIDDAIDTATSSTSTSQTLGTSIEDALSGERYITKPYVDPIISPTPEREPGTLEKWLHRGKSNIKETASNLWEKVIGNSINPGLLGSGGGKWIAGLGVAAAAIAMFHNANTPIQLDTRPEGHGVASPTNNTPNEIQFGDEGIPSKTPDIKMPSKVYLHDGEKGYTAKVKAKTSNDLNYKDLERQMTNSSGNVNINIRDERTTYDRRWLEEEFDSYITRGHLGLG